MTDKSTISHLQEPLNFYQKTAFYDDQRLLINALKELASIACLPYSSVAHDLELGVLQRLPLFCQQS